MSKTFTRRDFIAGSAVGILTAAGVAGCSTPQSSSAGKGSLASDARPDVVDTVECDILVAGSGTAGTFAAIRAAELGANVLWIEKLSSRGGTSAFTEGIAAIDSRLMKEANVDPKKDELWNSFMESQNWGVAPQLVNAYLDNNGPAIDWALEHGAELIYSPVSPDTYWGGVCITEEGFKQIGEGVLQHLWDYGDSLENLTFMTETPFRSLIIDDGKVVGAYAESPEGMIQINAQATLLATGGFCSNEELVTDYVRTRPGEIFFYGLEGRDGEGLQAVLDAGGYIHAPASCMYASGGVKGAVSMHDIACATFSWSALLSVNQDGVRYVSENLIMENDTAARNIAIRQQKAAWAIADGPFVQTYLDMGVYDFFTGVTTGDLAQEIEEYESIVKADTLDDLAKKMGVPADMLKKSVEEYNAAASSGDSVRFGLNPEYCVPVLEPPFYAAQLQAAAYGTEGGAATNEKMQVLTAEDSPVEGLYALGSDNGSLFYTNYPMNVVGGTGQGWAATSGFIAAQDAVDRYVK